jgi:hypothetical protein
MLRHPTGCIFIALKGGNSMIEQDKKPFKMDLQLFNDGPAEPPAEPTYSTLEGDIRNMLVETAPAEPGAPPVEPPAVEPGVPPAEPTPPVVEPAPAPAPVQDIMNNPIVQQLIQQSQMLQQTVQQQSEMMQQFIQNSMTNNAPQPSPVVTKTPEEIEAEKEQWMQSFYEKGPAAIEEMLNSRITAATEPLQKKLSSYEDKEAWNNAVGTMSADSQKYPEFENVRARMSEILFREKPYLMQSGDKVRALVDAYSLAVAEKGFAQPAAAPAQPMQMNMSDMMKSPEFIKQVMSNPEVMKMIAAEQARQIQTNSQQVPPMSPSSGVANVAPFIKDKPQNYNDLESDIKNSLHQGLL